MTAPGGESAPLPGGRAGLAPRSILWLTLTGFTLVLAPLILAMLYSISTVDAVSSQSQRGALNAVRATRLGRSLATELTRMERALRQYQVLQDGELFRLYLDGRQAFLKVAGELAGLDLEPEQRQWLAELRQEEQRLHQTLQRDPAQTQDPTQPLAAYRELARLAEAIIGHNGHLIDRTLAQTERGVERVRQTLVWQAVLAIVLALFTALLFSYLISRPIQAIQAAVRRLGAGDFERPVVVSGPQDLRRLGEQIEWLRRRLLDLEAEKTKFLRHMSHELKTPLTNLREGSGLLAEQVVGPLNREQAEIAGILQHNTQELQRRIEDLLDFARLSGQDEALQCAPLALDALITEIAADHKVELRARGLRLQLDLIPLQLQGDAGRLRVALDNLLANAIKFTPDRGRIAIELRSSDGQARIRVADSGPGVAAAEHGRVFEAFYQGQAGSRGPIRGSGLGLAIARESIHRHRGRLRLSEAAAPELGGALFEIILPIAPEACS